MLLQVLVSATKEGNPDPNLGKVIGDALVSLVGARIEEGERPSARSASPLLAFGGEKLDLQNVKFPEVYWRGVDARGVDFYRADFTRAGLRETFLQGAIFYSACLKACVLRDADLSEANLQEANLECADLASQLVVVAVDNRRALDVYPGVLCIGCEGLPSREGEGICSSLRTICSSAALRDCTRYCANSQRQDQPNGLRQTWYLHSVAR